MNTLDKSKVGFAFTMEFHHPTQSLRAKAECARPSEMPGEPYFLFPNDSAPEFEGLRLLAFFADDGKFTLIGFDFDYVKFLPINIACAEKMVKVMRTLGRRLDKLDVEEGRAQTFGEEIRRVCAILGFGQIWVRPLSTAGDLTWAQYEVEDGTKEIDRILGREERRRVEKADKTVSAA